MKALGILDPAAGRGVFAWDGNRVQYGLPGAGPVASRLSAT